MRFDFRGMGDSTGELRDFEEVNEDIEAAIDTFQAHCPQLERIVLWGLCDAASAILLYWDMTRDARVGGLVLLNPWVRSEATLARTHIKHYYGQRLLQAEFWRKLLSGKLGIGRALQGVVTSWLHARKTSGEAAAGATLPFQKRMMRALENYPGPALLILSSDDYTAKEFLEACQADAQAIRALAGARLTRVDVPGADHTFSSRDQRQAVEVATVAWLQQSTAR
jgi:exosortase A-associated hydrolase 1